jgi:hypothetical protein
MKKSLIAASLFVAATTMSACGGGSGSSSASAADAPTDASNADFCTIIRGTGPKASGKSVSKRLIKVGTPKGIPKEARAGFVLFSDKVSDLGSDPSSDDLTTLQKSLSAADLKKFTAFVTYLSTECP